MQDQLKDLAVKLFDDGSVDVIIGYENGTLPMRASPCVIRNAQEADRLVWNMNCGGNLATYLLPFVKANPDIKVGIMAKGCDSRSIVGMLKERQVEREQIFVIGMPCVGVIDRRKLETELNGAEMLEGIRDGDKLTVKHEDGELQVEIADYVHSACLTCQHKLPVLHDVLVDEPATAPAVEPYKHVEAMESQSADERWEYFVSEMSKCVRCYACRGTCPFCYCTQCFVDQNQPQWFGKTTELSDTIIFHLVRAFHVAGRCVNCGSCARACPMGIDLMALTKKIEKDMDGLYGYMAGMDVEQLSPFATFNEDDPQEFITEPE